MSHLLNRVKIIDLPGGAQFKTSSEDYVSSEMKRHAKNSAHTC